MVCKRYHHSYTRKQLKFKNEFDVNYNTISNKKKTNKNDNDINESINNEGNNNNQDETNKTKTKRKRKKSVLSKCRFVNKNTITNESAIRSAIPQNVISDIILDYTEILVENILNGKIVRIQGLCNFHKLEDGSLIVELSEKLVNKLKEQKQQEKKIRKKQKKISDDF